MKKAFLLLCLLARVSSAGVFIDDTPKNYPVYPGLRIAMNGGLGSRWSALPLLRQPVFSAQIQAALGILPQFTTVALPTNCYPGQEVWDTTAATVKACQANGTSWGAVGGITASGTNVFTGKNTFNDGANGINIANAADATKLLIWDASAQATLTTQTFKLVDGATSTTVLGGGVGAGSYILGSASSSSGGANSVNIGAGAGTTAACGAGVAIGQNAACTVSNGIALGTFAGASVSVAGNAIFNLGGRLVYSIKTLSTTSGTAQAIFQFSPASNTSGGAEFSYAITATQATPHNGADAGTLNVSWQNTGGTCSVGFSTTPGGTTAATGTATTTDTGTLLGTPTVTQSACVISINVTPTWTTLVPTTVTGYFFVVNKSATAVSVQ